MRRTADGKLTVLWVFLGTAALSPPSVRGGVEPGEVKPFAGSGAVVGRVSAAKGCALGEAQVWVSSGSTLLYQAAVMAGATFEFHVMPGPIEVVATSKEGCFAETRLVARADQVSAVELGMSRLARKSEPLAKAKKRDGRSPAAMWCPYCGTQSNYYSMPMAGMPFMPMGMPWWAPYGMMNYSNFYYPGPWMNGGIYGPMYPGPGGGWMNGGAVMGKPNLYVSAPAGTKLKLRVDFPEEHNLLAAIPLHGKSGWEAEVVAPYRLKAGDASYAYLFYDYRFNAERLQREEGFCVKAEELLGRLASELVRSGFAAYEVKDFKGYWQYKMPRSSDYCVYPQDERQLAGIAPLQASPSPASVTRVGFMVVPQEEGRTALWFQAKPLREWAPHRRDSGGVVVPVSASGRAPAAESVQLREWGVGFVRGQ